jgi:hypothetical protein
MNGTELNFGFLPFGVGLVVTKSASTKAAHRFDVSFDAPRTAVVYYFD